MHPRIEWCSFCWLEQSFVLNAAPHANSRFHWRTQAKEILICASLIWGMQLKAIAVIVCSRGESLTTIVKPMKQFSEFLLIVGLGCTAALVGIGTDLLVDGASAKQKEPTSIYYIFQKIWERTKANVNSDIGFISSSRQCKEIKAHNRMRLADQSPR